MTPSYIIIDYNQKKFALYDIKKLTIKTFDIKAKSVYCCEELPQNKLVIGDSGNNLYVFDLSLE